MKVLLTKFIITLLWFLCSEKRIYFLLLQSNKTSSAYLYVLAEMQFVKICRNKVTEE